MCGEGKYTIEDIKEELTHCQLVHASCHMGIITKQQNEAKRIR